ncbi:hypothetical protein [Methanothermococcus okinawensis]|uniref:Uncharacterized protein n=1 Tax=Methanothermococcus okinawensis (strain DSM 14208 / JCM 11175 / IH1) TaxID=647113 RepID=F8AKY4_METOI|nr:hypothetical protein [Methanothermococcus okinawensis]AEH06386.1 hypothetical protein Metok_0399 [Methanothermococcus okinawensis IH1]
MNNDKLETKINGLENHKPFKKSKSIDIVKKPFNYILKYFIKQSCCFCLNKDRCETYLKYHKKRE